jgi:small subunit ribosomal protein S17
MSAPTRNKRKTFIGSVTSRMGDKSVKVTVPYRTPHAKYQKVINRQTIVHMHDAKNESKVGDQVEVMETRPLSRLKRWRLVRIVEAAKTGIAQAISEQDVAKTVPTKLTPAPVPAASPAEAPAAANASPA